MNFSSDMDQSSSYIIRSRARKVNRMRRPTGIKDVKGSILGHGTIYRRDLVLK